MMFFQQNGHQNVKLLKNRENVKYERIVKITKQIIKILLE